MLEVLEQNGDTLETFTNKLDTTKSYYFILIHHEIKGIIDYSDRFGKNYKKLALVGVRNDKLKLIMDNNSAFLSNTIITPPEMSLKNIYDMDEASVYSKPTYEGIIVMLIDNEGRDTIVKLQTQSYQFYNITNNNNLSKGYLYLYQQNKLSSFLSEQKLRNDSMQKHDITSLTDAVFKVVSSELFELFKLLWNVQTGKQVQTALHTKLYSLLSKEYKDILYIIRGIYFSKKSEFFNKKNMNSELSHDDYRASLLRPSDIYNILKTTNIDLLYGLLKERYTIASKLNNHDELELFNTTMVKSSPYYLSKCNIFMSLLFGETQHIA
jgi:hypothetical protein